MASFEWAGYNGSDWTTFDISDTNLLKFAGADYDDKVVVGEYNDSFHIRTSSGDDSDACGSPHLTNLKYLTSSTVSIDGGSSVDVDTVLTTECIRIQFTHGSSVAIENAIFYVYDGTTTTTPPTGVTFQAFEQGDTSWTNAEGSASAVDLDNKSSSTEHNFYIGMSASPSSTGEKTNFAGRIELDYY